MCDFFSFNLKKKKFASSFCWPKSLPFASDDDSPSGDWLGGERAVWPPPAHPGCHGLDLAVPPSKAAS